MVLEEMAKRAERLYPDNSEYRIAYVCGARIERQLTINEACEWLQTTLISLCQFNDTNEGFIEKFRKAMEE